jgi:hypothetical protein
LPSILSRCGWMRALETLFEESLEVFGWLATYRNRYLSGG